MAYSDWSREEVEVVVTDYFHMLKLELSGIKFKKSEHRRQIMPLLDDRSDRAIDSKHQNISAVLAQLDRTYISGYKPYWHYQGLLREVILERLKELEALDPLMKSHKQYNFMVDTTKLTYQKWLVKTPELSALFNEPAPLYHTAKPDYAKLEQRNKSIGDSGEKLVFNYEKWRLKELGKPNLAKKVEWVSRDKGDGAGYDILSKNHDGSDRCIEVKTTTLGKETPIFFTKRENDFSENNPKQFHMYRVFDLMKRPKMFQFQGPFSSYLNIEAQSFKGFF